MPVRPQKTVNNDFVDVFPLEPDAGDAGAGSSSGDGQVNGEDAPEADGAAAAQEEPGVQSAEPRRQQVPNSPDPAQVDSHVCAEHIEFQPWCIDCIRGRSYEWQHFCADRSADGVATILWDYAYLGCPSEGCSNAEQEAAEEQRGSSPILVAWDTNLKKFWCWVVPSKGVDFEGIDAVLKVVVADVSCTGYKKVVFRNDGENSLMALFLAMV